MADKRRFALFAAFLRGKFPEAKRVFDVAGGMGALNVELEKLGFETTTFDARKKRLDVRYAERRFTLEEPCACDLVVGMHPDGATRVIVEYAAEHGVPFAIVPCCSDNGLPYKSWMKHLDALAREKGLSVEEAVLPMEGRARVLVGLSARGTS